MHIPAAWCAGGRPSAVHHEAAFLSTHSMFVRACEQMPFGTNKRLSGPRPKKKKVVRIEEEPEELPSIQEDAGGAEEWK